jgi:di/tripeptidase
VTIQPEKEMIMILADAAQSCGIMQAIANVHGPGTDAGAVSFSMPASHAMGIGNDMANAAKK